MVSFASLILACSAVAGVFAAPTPTELVERSTPTGSGINNGFYYRFWTDGVATATYNNGAAGEYSVQWSGNNGDFFGGKGWEVGSGRNITYDGTFTTTGDAYLSVYGFTTNPLVEYYIVEFGSYVVSPTNWEVVKKGTVTTDGGIYDIFQTVPIKSLPGYVSALHFWSVRQTKRVGGTVTVQNHFDAWAKAGMNLGSTFDYQIVATEGINSSGSANITVSGP